MNILGLTHPISWNNAACLLVDGELVAMVEEERLNRVKHAPRMPPSLAMAYCLESAGITLDQVDYVAIGFDSAIKTALGHIRINDLISGLNQAAHWLHEGSIYERKLPLSGFDRDRTIFVNHHLAHAASTFYASGFETANILSLDGSGGTESGILAVGQDSKIEILDRISNRGSWGLIYEELTDRLGFRRHSGEGKVMGLAAYGKPDPDGLPCVDWDGEIPKIIPARRKAFVRSIKPRQKTDPISKEHKNLAATLQHTLERAAVCMAEWLFAQTGYRRLCLAGGTALNCSMNGRLARLPFVDEIFIQPAAHDAGTSLGAALQVHLEKTGEQPQWRFEHVFWGPSYSEEEIESALRAFQELDYSRSKDICRDTAQLIAEGNIVGWFQGRAEIGPRALGNRSILADPSRPEMKDRVNKQVKNREPWRPFAPSILEEDIKQFVEKSIRSPFMILAFEARPDSLPDIVSAAHIDGTIRPQTVSRKTNLRYWELINRFREITGIPAVLNTSFNVNTQPIVNTPEEAVDTFLNTRMNALAIGDFVVRKRPLP